MIDTKNFKEQSRLLAQEIRLLDQCLHDKYGNDIPLDVLREITEELKVTRGKYGALIKKLFPEKWREL